MKHNLKKLNVHVNFWKSGPPIFTNQIRRRYASVARPDGVPKISQRRVLTFKRVLLGGEHASKVQN